METIKDSIQLVIRVENKMQNFATLEYLKTTFIEMRSYFRTSQNRHYDKK